MSRPTISSISRFSRRGTLKLLAAAAASPAFGMALSRHLFCFDNGTGRDQKLPLDQQAELLREAGYAGMGLFTGTARIPEILSALDARKLRLLGIYVHSFVDQTEPRIDPGLEQAIRELKGRETMIVLTLRGKGPDAEQRAVENVRTVAAMCQESGLRVCLYPHINFYVETAADGIRVLRKAGKKNVGVAINMIHELDCLIRAGKEPGDWNAIVRPAVRHAFLASVNGVVREGNKTKVCRLDQGNFDVKPFLKALDSARYRGPVSLQMYQVPGEIGENLKRAREAWERLLSESFH